MGIVVCARFAAADTINVFMALLQCVSLRVPAPAMTCTRSCRCPRPRTHKRHSDLRQAASKVNRLIARPLLRSRCRGRLSSAPLRCLAAAHDRRADFSREGALTGNHSPRRRRQGRKHGHRWSFHNPPHRCRETFPSRVKHPIRLTTRQSSSPSRHHRIRRTGNTSPCLSRGSPHTGGTTTEGHCSHQLMGQQELRARPAAACRPGDLKGNPLTGRSTGRRSYP